MPVIPGHGDIHGNFVAHLSHHTEPLRQLLKKVIMFYWDNQINQSFQQIKTLLREAQSKLLGYYDRKKTVIVQADSSLRGLGACLIQYDRPITQRKLPQDNRLQHRGLAQLRSRLWRPETSSPYT